MMALRIPMRTPWNRVATLCAMALLRTAAMQSFQLQSFVMMESQTATPMPRGLRCAIKAVTYCGDGIVAPEELCDEGTTPDASTGCSATCERLGTCGDGIVQAAFESCDGGPNPSILVSMAK